MNCPFCEKDLRFYSYNHVVDHYVYMPWDEYGCDNHDCWIKEGNFSRYKYGINLTGQLVFEEYVLDTFYVKVNMWSGHSYIYKMMSCMLMDEVEVPCSLWLNVKNKRATLDKLKIMVMFS